MCFHVERDLVEFIGSFVLVPIHTSCLRMHFLSYDDDYTLNTSYIVCDSFVADPRRSGRNPDAASMAVGW